MEENYLVKRELHGLWSEEKNDWISEPHYRNTKQLVRGLKKQLKRSDIRTLLKNNKEATINKSIKAYCEVKYDRIKNKLFKANKVTFERYKVPNIF